MVSGESAAPKPIAGGQPFAVVWNVPTGRCWHRFGVDLPLGNYGIVENLGGQFAGQNITIFYKNQFGLYPYLSRQGIPRNGGIPQRVPLRTHLGRVAGDIHLRLQPAFRGLAVVDWEEWRPLWARNWGAKRIYQVASERWVWDRHPHLPAPWRLRLAQEEFEQAAQALMEQTLLLGKTLRPEGLWGFYRFPDCFNSNWAKEANYTGQCRPAEVLRNNQLRWLWAASAALSPSIYLPLMLPQGLRHRYVHHRLREALRVAAFGATGILPIIAYSRLSYRRSPRFLGLADLVHTIGESAALGASGLVLWGDMSYSRSATAWEEQMAPPQQSPPTPMAASLETSACIPWSPSVTCTGPQEGTRVLRVRPGQSGHQPPLCSPALPGAPHTNRDSPRGAAVWVLTCSSLPTAAGNGPAQSSTLHRPHTHSAPCPAPRQPLLPMLRPVPAATACPCLGPCHPLFLALLCILALASLVLATLAIYLSVLQSQSVRALTKWLESQEEAVQQLQATSRQLWAHLNASEEAGGHR
nr:PREDICTED: hyaluronidase-3 isoform X2 [Struthio camelus australis]